EEVGHNVMSKSLDDRVSVFVMIEAIKATKGSTAEIVAVATTQEEVGLRGAQTAAFDVAPDVAGARATPPAGGMRASKRQAITRLGQGVALKVMDSSHISHPKLLQHFRDLAERHNIRYQFEILPRGGTDAGAMQLARGGAPAITLSVPTRYVHTVNEMAAVDDIDGCIQLLARYLEDAGNRSYGYEVG